MLFPHVAPRLGIRCLMSFGLLFFLGVLLSGGRERYYQDSPCTAFTGTEENGRISKWAVTRLVLLSRAQFSYRLMDQFSYHLMDQFSYRLMNQAWNVIIGEKAGKAPNLEKEKECGPSSRLLAVCGRLAPSTLLDVFSKYCEPESSVKVGEGTHGEAFKVGNTVCKIVPCDGDLRVNREVQKRSEELLEEVIPSQMLNLCGGHGSDAYNVCTTIFIETLAGNILLSRNESATMQHTGHTSRGESSSDTFNTVVQTPVLHRNVSTERNLLYNLRVFQEMPALFGDDPLVDRAIHVVVVAEDDGVVIHRGFIEDDDPNVHDELSFMWYRRHQLNNELIFYFTLLRVTMMELGPAVDLWPGHRFIEYIYNNNYHVEPPVDCTTLRGIYIVEKSNWAHRTIWNNQIADVGQAIQTYNNFKQEIEGG